LDHCHRRARYAVAIRFLHEFQPVLIQDGSLHVPKAQLRKYPIAQSEACKVENDVNALIRPLARANGIEPHDRKVQISEAEVEAALRTILDWIGEDPDRDGLRETPARVMRAFQEHFCGYGREPERILEKTFEEIEGYDEMIVLRSIAFQSHCEHHMAPFFGHAWVGYVPDRRVVGISKLARVVEAYAKRLQIQERMTAQIANTIDSVLKPQGVAVVLKATHHCMTARGVRKSGTDLVTSRMLGCFRNNPATRQEFTAMVQSVRQD
jgi:GTP cyclohydrolase I